MIATALRVPIPIHHPFWMALVIALPFAALSGVFVFAQGWRIDRELPEVRMRIRGVRFAAAVGVAFMMLGVGVLAGLAFSWARAAWPGGAASVFAIGSLTIGVALTIQAFRAKERRKILPTAIALNALFAIAFGWVLPALMGG